MTVDPEVAEIYWVWSMNHRVIQLPGKVLAWPSLGSHAASAKEEEIFMC